MAFSTAPLLDSDSCAMFAVWISVSVTSDRRRIAATRSLCRINSISARRSSSRLAMYSGDSFANRVSCSVPLIVSSAIAHYAPWRQPRSSCAIAILMTAHVPNGTPVRQALPHAA